MRATARMRPAAMTLSTRGSLVRRQQHGGILLWLLVVLVVCILVFVVYLLRVPLLRAFGDWWVVSDRLEKAQAIVVLGGDSTGSDRVQRAVTLYREGWAPRLVVSGPAVRTYLSEAELMQREALKLGVPQDKLLVVPHTTTSTLEEALHLRKVFAEHGLRRVIVVTSNFHARRVRRIFRKLLREHGTQVWVDAAADRRFVPERWWQEREGRAVLLLEILKTIYAWWELRHVPPPATGAGHGLLALADVL